MGLQAAINAPTIFTKRLQITTKPENSFFNDQLEEQEIGFFYCMTPRIRENGWFPSSVSLFTLLLPELLSSHVVQML